MADNKQIAQQVLAAVGGKENVVSVTHCMTRLRFVLKDQTVPAKNGITRVKGVIGVNQQGDQYQVIIGNSVANVYKELVTLGVSNEGAAAGPKKKENPVTVALDFIAGCMTPLFTAIIAGAALTMVDYVTFIRRDHHRAVLGGEGPD